MPDISGINSVNNNFISEAEEQIEAGEVKKELFDNKDAIKVSKQEASDIKDAVNDIDDGIKSASEDSKANSLAKQKAQEYKSSGYVGTYDILEEPTVKGNIMTVKIKDSKGRDGLRTVAYCADGSYRIITTMNGDMRTSYFDKDGNRIRFERAKDGKVAKISYDTDGKRNNSFYEDDETGKSVSVMYDNNEQVSKRIYSDGINTYTTQYEYDENGTMVGSYKIKENEQTQEQTKTTTVINGDTKTQFIVKADGSTTTVKYEKGDNGKWVLMSKSKTDSSGEVIQERTYGEPETSSGTTTRNLIVKDGSDTFYEVQTLDKNGRVTHTDRYSDKDKTEKVASYDFKYSKRGYRTQIKETSYEDDSEKGKTTTTKFSEKTGKVQSTESKSSDDKFLGLF